jgi:micrococcal nuclease
MKLIIALLIAIAWPVLNGPATVTGKVVSVIDGNTLEVESPQNGIQKIVLDGIDAPEPEQEFGTEARIFLEERVLHKIVSLEFRGKDRNGNHIGIVTVGDDDVRVDLLRGGFAWTVEKNTRDDLEGYRKWAQLKGKGLWKNPGAIAPWVFRRQQSMSLPKSS